MEVFAERYCTCNPGAISESQDTVYVLAFSVIILQTDLHNPQIKLHRKMDMESFILNNRGKMVWSYQNWFGLRFSSFLLPSLVKYFVTCSRGLPSRDVLLHNYVPRDKLLLHWLKEQPEMHNGDVQW